MFPQTTLMASGRMATPAHCFGEAKSGEGDNIKPEDLGNTIQNIRSTGTTNRYKIQHAEGFRDLVMLVPMDGKKRLSVWYQFRSVLAKLIGRGTYKRLD